MSFTIPISYPEIDRQLENIVNRLQRHCKVGKVMPKPQPRILGTFDMAKLQSQTGQKTGVKTFLT